MYVCVYVCMYVCMFACVCMCVCDSNVRARKHGDSKKYLAKVSACFDGDDLMDLTLFVI